MQAGAVCGIKIAPKSNIIAQYNISVEIIYSQPHVTLSICPLIKHSQTSNPLLITQRTKEQRLEWRNGNKSLQLYSRLERFEARFVGLLIVKHETDGPGSRYWRIVGGRYKGFILDWINVSNSNSEFSLVLYDHSHPRRVRFKMAGITSEGKDKLRVGRHDLKSFHSLFRKLGLDEFQKCKQSTKFHIHKFTIGTTPEQYTKFRNCKDDYTMTKTVVFQCWINIGIPDRSDVTFSSYIQLLHNIQIEQGWCRTVEDQKDYANLTT